MRLKSIEGNSTLEIRAALKQFMADCFTANNNVRTYFSLTKLIGKIDEKQSAIF